MLGLGAKNSSANGISSLDLPPVSSLKFAMAHVQLAIEEEFGDPLYHTSNVSENAMGTEDLN